MVEFEQDKAETLHVYVTGFGKFAGVADNPTTHIVDNLENILESNPCEGLEIIGKQILLCGMEECHDTMTEAYSKIEEMIKEGAQGKKFLVLNFGVAAGRSKFSLEDRGKNIADFRCMDERGN